MKYSKNSLHINFLNLLHHYDIKDTITFDTGIDAPVNFKLTNLPPYTCGVYLTWNDKKLDYHLPSFISCGEVVTGSKIQHMHSSKDDSIIFGNGKLDINIDEALDNEYKDDNFLLLNAKFIYKNKTYQGKYVYWHLNDLDTIFYRKEEVVEYLNNLPYKIKIIKQYNLPPIQ